MARGFWDRIKSSGKGLDALDVVTMGLSSEGVKNTAKDIGTGVKDWATNKDAKDALKQLNRDQNSIAQQQLDLQREMYQQNRTDMMPWYESGKKYLGRMTDLYDQGAFDVPESQLTYDPTNVMMDPGFDFRKQQAINAIKYAGSARGNRLSGGTMAGLSDYISNMASDEYNKAYGRQYGLWQDNLNRRVASKADQFGRLSGLAGTGMAQASNLANLGQGYASNMGNIYGQMSQNKAGYTQGMINAQQMSPFNQFINQIPGLAVQGLGSYYGAKNG